MDYHEPRRYVVHLHELSAFRHWDLMLEQAEALATWQLAVPPELVAAAESEDPGSGVAYQDCGDGVGGSAAGRASGIPVPTSEPPSVGIPAKRLSDHRKAYLDYEGPVSGDRGEVHIVDSGTYALLAADETEWLVELAGRVLRGRFRLVRQADTPDGWRLIPCRGSAAEAARRGT